MCGINGFLFKDEALLDKMLQATKHRGPDDQGTFFDDKISLGHNRLSIIDPSSAGHQPMESSDKNLVITYNGELYNFKELKSELSDYDFKTKTDTEVILAAYQKWGKECVKKFNGIFAFTIWDKTREELFLARDQLGVKPLYYYHDEKKFIFSSEIKGILCHSIAHKLDTDAINMFFRLLYIPEPKTPWKSVFKLPAAHYAIFKGSNLSKQRYWQVESFDTLSDKQEIIQRVKSGFKKSVERQLISDKPLGLYLSGGIDSTAILGVMSELRKKPVQTFSVGFDIDIQKEKYNADFNIAKQTAKHFNSDHHEVLVRAKDVKDNFENVVRHADDPVVNHTQATMYVLAKFAKQKVDVVLTGDGGDEIFAGYDRYYLNAMLDKIQRIPSFARKNIIAKSLLSAIGKQDVYDKLNIRSRAGRFCAFMVQKEHMISQFLNPDFNCNNAAQDFIDKKFSSESHVALPKDSTKFLMYADIVGWLVDDALNRGDRMSMAHGLEARVPFLDVDLVELAMQIPAKYNLDTREHGKKIFREALSEYIPDFVLDQPKRGWFSPVAKWLRGDLKDWSREILSEDYNPKTKAIFDFDEIQKIFDAHLSGEKYALNTIWSIICFQVWLKQFYK